MFDQKTKEAWIYDLASRLVPMFNALAFRRSGNLVFRRKHDAGCEWKYLLSVRHPRHAGDQHALYVNPCVHIIYPDVEKANSILTESRLNHAFPTLGGSLGLYTYEAHIKEWPVDNQQEALALTAQFEDDVRHIGLTFWESLTPRRALLEAVEAKQPWAGHSDSWKYRHLVLRYLENGIDSAMELLIDNPNKFRGIDAYVLRKQLLALPRTE